MSTAAERAAERTAFAPVKLALEGASELLAVTAEPLYRGWWKVSARTFCIEVYAPARRQLPEVIQLRMAGHYPTGRVYGPRAKATRLAHGDAA